MISTGSTFVYALVVEDSIVSQRLLDMLLRKMGFKVEFVDNGLDAVDKITTMRFDIVFLDIMIPKLNGYKVCKTVKKNPQTKDVPIIMLTSRDGTFDKVRGKMAGTNDYLTKPLQIQYLTDTVSKYFPFQDGKLAIGLDEIQSKPMPVKRLKTTINTKKVLKPAFDHPRKTTQTSIINKSPVKTNNKQETPSPYTGTISNALKLNRNSALLVAKKREEHLRRLSALTTKIQKKKSTTIKNQIKNI